MSGYLRWLAQRALGPASGVRPAPRQPSFAVAPSPGSDFTAAFAEPARLRDFGAAERRFDARSPDLTAAAPSDAMPATPLSSVAQPVAPQTNDFSAAAAAQDLDASAPRPASDPDRRVEYADHSSVDDRPRRADREIADRNTSSNSSSRAGLLPRAALAPRMATRLTRNGPAADPSDRRLAAAPDVHVHIGRVELTALTPPAAPRRESAATTKKPMSLDEYLRRRSGRPS